MKRKSASQTTQTPSWKNAILLAITALAFSTSTAFGATATWTDGIGNWLEPGNWDTDQIPGPTTDAVINNGGTAQVFQMLGTAEALSLTLGQSVGYSGTVLVGASHGDMAVGGTIFVGYRGSGTLTITEPGGELGAEARQSHHWRASSGSQTARQKWMVHTQPGP